MARYMSSNKKLFDTDNHSDTSGPESLEANQLDETHDVAIPKRVVVSPPFDYLLGPRFASTPNHRTLDARVGRANQISNRNTNIPGNSRREATRETDQRSAPRFPRSQNIGNLGTVKSGETSGTSRPGAIQGTSRMGAVAGNSRLGEVPRIFRTLTTQRAIGMATSGTSGGTSNVPTAQGRMRLGATQQILSTTASEIPKTGAISKNLRTEIFSSMLKFEEAMRSRSGIFGRNLRTPVTQGTMRLGATQGNLGNSRTLTGQGTLRTETASLMLEIEALKSRLGAGSRTGTSFKKEKASLLLEVEALRSRLLAIRMPAVASSRALTGQGTLTTETASLLLEVEALISRLLAIRETPKVPATQATTRMATTEKCASSSRQQIVVSSGTSKIGPHHQYVQLSVPTSEPKTFSPIAHRTRNRRNKGSERQAVPIKSEKTPHVQSETSRPYKRMVVNLMLAENGNAVSYTKIKKLMAERNNIGKNLVEVAVRNLLSDDVIYRISGTGLNGSFKVRAHNQNKI